MKREIRYIIKSDQAIGRRGSLAMYAALWLFADRFHSGDWVKWVIIGAAAISAILYFYDMATHKQVKVDIQDLLKSQFDDQEAQANKYE